MAEIGPLRAIAASNALSDGGRNRAFGPGSFNPRPIQNARSNFPAEQKSKAGGKTYVPAKTRRVNAVETNQPKPKMNSGIYHGNTESTSKHGYTRKQGEQTV